MTEANTRAIVKRIVSRTLEIEPDALGETDNFVEAHGADSLRMIEVLAALERELQIRIDQAELANMTDLAAVQAIVDSRMPAHSA